MKKASLSVMPSKIHSSKKIEEENSILLKTLKKTTLMEKKGNAPEITKAEDNKNIDIKFITKETYSEGIEGNQMKSNYDITKNIIKDIESEFNNKDKIDTKDKENTDNRMLIEEDTIKTITSKESCELIINNILRKDTNINENTTDKAKFIREKANESFFEYDHIDFNEDLSYSDVLNNEVKKNLKDDKEQYLYFQNRDDIYQNMKIIIDRNISNDKRELHSLNNNNGSGKSYLLQMLHYIMNVDKENDDIFFSPAITMTKDYTSKSLFIAILDSINLSFDLRANPIVPESNKEYYCYNSDTCNILENLSRYISTNKKEEEKKEAWNILMKNYVFDNDYQEGKKYISRKYSSYCFLFDEVGNAELMHQNNNLESKYNVFSEESKKTIRKINKLRDIIRNHLLVRSNLDVILAGKNGLVPFMADTSNSYYKINQFNLPPLSKEYLPSILKFELFKKDSNFRSLLRREFTKENKNDANLNKFFEALLEKIFLYTGGHPRILYFSLEKLMKIESIEDILDKFQLDLPSKSNQEVNEKLIKLMEKIKPDDFEGRILSKFNDNLLYELFYERINTFEGIDKEYIIITFYYYLYERFEIKINTGTFTNLLDRFIRNITILMTTDYSDIRVDSEQFMNAVGLPFKIDKDYNIVVYFPKYVVDSLEEVIKKGKIKDKLALTYLYYQCDSNAELYEEVASICLLAKNFSQDNNNYSNRFFKYIPHKIHGISKSKGYIKGIFTQLSQITANNGTNKDIDFINKIHIVLFKFQNDYAFDGIVIMKDKDKKYKEILTLSFIQVKSTIDKFRKSDIANKIYHDIIKISKQIKNKFKNGKQLRFLNEDYDYENIIVRYVVDNPIMSDIIVTRINESLKPNAETNTETNVETNNEKPEVLGYDYSYNKQKVQESDIDLIEKIIKLK